jgi:hypothetical protein
MGSPEENEMRLIKAVHETFKKIKQELDGGNLLTVDNMTIEDVYIFNEIDSVATFHNLNLKKYSDVTVWRAIYILKSGN